LFEGEGGGLEVPVQSCTVLAFTSPRELNGDVWLVLYRETSLVYMAILCVWIGFRDLVLFPFTTRESGGRPVCYGERKSAFSISSFPHP